MKAHLLWLCTLLPGSGPALAGEGGPLPGEIVTRIGQVAALPADQRRVPGFAGAWRPAAAQDKTVGRIRALEERLKSCTDVRILDSVQAAPDLLETRPRAVHHALERWTVAACGAQRDYDVYYSFERDSSRLMVVENGSVEFQAELEPAYRRLRELAAQRRTEEADGRVRWLNLPLPPDSVPIVTSPASSPTSGWSMEFVPFGEDRQEWTQLVAVQGLPRLPGSGQAVQLLEGMQQARAARCGQPAGEVDILPPGRHAPAGMVVQTYLVCPRVPDTNFAELAVVKAIEGPDYLYVVQRAWRLPAGPADEVRAAGRAPKAAADAFLAGVQLCNPAADRSACPSPFPR